MIITKTPYRISFVGGGSDIQAFYEHNDGSVISACIRQHMYITLHPSFNPKEYKIKYNQIEVVSTIDAIEHPIVKAALQHVPIDHGIEMICVGDIPAQTGLGSSSSFTVGLLRALYAYKGITRTKEQIAQEACEIEINDLHEPIGKQDQYAASFGGLNQFIFHRNGAVDAIPITMNPQKLEELQQSLILIFTGRTRAASTVLAQQTKNLQSSQEKRDILKKMVDLASPLREDLERGNIDTLGEYLHQNWILKKQLATNISDDEIDVKYSIARKAGAIGGKILGAGGGGFFLFYCPPMLQRNVIAALNGQIVPISFDFQGSKEVYSS